MAERGEPRDNPRRKIFYSATALIGLVGGSVFAFDMYTNEGAPFVWRLVRASIAIVFFVGALQALERLFRPEKARARSIALSMPNLEALRLTRKTLAVMCLLGFLVAGILRFTGYARDVVPDLQILSGVCFFVAYILADLCGEKLSSGWGSSPPLREKFN
jgi:hypothetical protein